MPISELGHVGLYVNDLAGARAFYADILGLHVTDEDDDLGMVFLSSRPQEEHHELVLCRARGANVASPQQVSFRCPDLPDVLEYWKRFCDAGVNVERTVTHGNAIGIYFYDPEGNRCEVYTRTGLTAKQPLAMPVDLSQDADQVWADVRAIVDEFGATGTPQGDFGPLTATTGSQR